MYVTGRHAAAVFAAAAVLSTLSSLSAHCTIIRIAPHYQPGQGQTYDTMRDEGGLRTYFNIEAPRFGPECRLKIDQLKLKVSLSQVLERQVEAFFEGVREDMESSRSEIVYKIFCITRPPAIGDLSRIVALVEQKIKHHLDLVTGRVGPSGVLEPTLPSLSPDEEAVLSRVKGELASICVQFVLPPFNVLVERPKGNWLASSVGHVEFTAAEIQRHRREYREVVEVLGEPSPSRNTSMGSLAGGEAAAGVETKSAGTKIVRVFPQYMLADSNSSSYLFSTLSPRPRVSVHIPQSLPGFLSVYGKTLTVEGGRTLSSDMGAGINRIMNALRGRLFTEILIHGVMPSDEDLGDFVNSRDTLSRFELEKFTWDVPLEQVLSMANEFIFPPFHWFHGEYEALPTYSSYLGQLVGGTSTRIGDGATTAAVYKVDTFEQVKQVLEEFCLVIEAVAAGSI